MSVIVESVRPVLFEDSVLSFLFLAWIPWALRDCYR